MFKIQGEKKKEEIFKQALQKLSDLCRCINTFL